MSLNSNIHAKLSADAGITAICGDKVFPVLAKAGTAAPFVTWTVISVTPVNSHTGATSLDRYVMQFSCYGQSYTQAHDLVLAVRDSLENQTLTDGANGTLVDINEGYEADTRLHAHQLTMHFWQQR